MKEVLKLDEESFEKRRKKIEKSLRKFVEETGGNVIFPKLKKSTKFEDLLTELFTEQTSKR